MNNAFALACFLLDVVLGNLPSEVFAGEAVLSAELLQHLETEARAMGVLDLIK